jgi:hypothetical protein
MAIPFNITTELSSLQAQVAIAAPLASAPFSTIKAIQLNAGNLVNDIQTALTGASALDTWTAPPDPISMATGFNSLVAAAEDQGNLSLMRGVAGRAASNLDQL